MSEIVTNAARMMELLPESDKVFAYEFIKKLVKAWDPDYTKLTPDEERALLEAENGEFIDEDEINWDDLFDK